MIVYGDHDEIADPGQRYGALCEAVARLGQMPPGIELHSRLVGALIDAGRLLQGVADSHFERAGEDGRSAPTDALTNLLHSLSQAVRISWDSAFSDLPDISPEPRLEGLPVQVRLRVPEGFAFYGVYPEAYLEAARRLTLKAPARVIGVRSIGTTLGAMVATALGARPPVSVRPFGDPFARQIAIAPELERELLEGDAHYVIVDEGPGQSGSSFGAVADWLDGHGVPLERITFIPSHDGAPGPRAGERHRRRWERAQRVTASFGNALPRLLVRWTQPFLGRLQVIEDISAGKWRQHLYAHEEEWPAAVPAWERYKFLADAGGGKVLLKFAGVGSIGENKLAMATALHREGYAPEPLGLAHGFLIERWCDARALTRGDRPVATIGEYIGARARLFPAPPGSGASLPALFDMCRENVRLSLGEAAARKVDEWRPRLPALSRRLVRVKTDNRLSPHEWLRSRAGLLIKTDALDHHASHELIGCQPVEWDAAGAIAEFGMDSSDRRTLVSAIEAQTGRELDRQLLKFCRVAYLGFAIGRTSLGADLSRSDASEERRLRALAHQYAAQLGQLLESSSSPTRLESLVD